MFFLNAISYSSIRHMENSFLSILYLGALTLKNTEIPLFLSYMTFPLQIFRKFTTIQELEVGLRL